MNSARLLTPAEAAPPQRRVAGALAARGLRAGDRVAFLGALRSGVVAVPLNPALVEEEPAALLADAEPGLVVDDAAGLAQLLGGPEAELAPVPLSRPMHYTSGTTGRPKGVWSGVLSE